MGHRTTGEIERIVKRCSFPGFDFDVGIHDPSQWNSPFYLQVVCKDGVDTATGEPASWKGRKWQLSHWMTDTEIVQTAWLAVQRALMHEACELFRFDDVAIYDRHLSVHKLVELASASDAQDGRHDGMEGS